MVHYLLENMWRVIGGGNSGVEAAIDLAGIVNEVTLLASSTMKADPVLQERVKTISNVTVIENAQINEITGTDKVNGISYIDRETGDEHHIELQGVFVQIGTIPNTEWLDGTLELINKVKLLLIIVVLQVCQEFLQLETVQIVNISKLLSRWEQVQLLHLVLLTI